MGPKNAVGTKLFGWILSCCEWSYPKFFKTEGWSLQLDHFGSKAWSTTGCITALKAGAHILVGEPCLQFSIRRYGKMLEAPQQPLRMWGFRWLVWFLRTRIVLVAKHSCQCFAHPCVTTETLRHCKDGVWHCPGILEVLMLVAMIR